MKNFINKYRYLAMLLLCIALYCSHANAVIYKITDENGHSHFSDTPQKNSSTVTLKPVNHYASTNPSNSTNSSEKSNKTAASTYKKFAILNPKDQQTLQNTSEIAVELQIQPSLKPGDSIEFSLDNHTLPAATDTKITLNEITRGEHKLQARLMGADKKVLMTTPIITVYVHQVNTINPS